MSFPAHCSSVRLTPTFHPKFDCLPRVFPRLYAPVTPSGAGRPSPRWVGALLYACVSDSVCVCVCLCECVGAGVFVNMDSRAAATIFSSDGLLEGLRLEYAATTGEVRCDGRDKSKSSTTTTPLPPPPPYRPHAHSLAHTLAHTLTPAHTLEHRHRRTHTHTHMLSVGIAVFRLRGTPQKLTAHFTRAVFSN